jgi:hypothetical protein
LRVRIRGGGLRRASPKPSASAPPSRIRPPAAALSVSATFIVTTLFSFRATVPSTVARRLGASLVSELDAGRCGPLTKLTGNPAARQNDPAWAIMTIWRLRATCVYFRRDSFILKSSRRPADGLRKPQQSSSFHGDAVVPRAPKIRLHDRADFN